MFTSVGVVGKERADQEQSGARAKIAQKVVTSGERWLCSSQIPLGSVPSPVREAASQPPHKYDHADSVNVRSRPDVYR